MSYHNDLILEGDRLTGRQYQELPGAAARTDEHNARIVFVLHDRNQQERYFETQAVALQAKKRLGLMSYRFAYVQYWHHAEKIWIG